MKSTKSQKSTSAWLPTEMQWEKPTFWLMPRSIIVPMTAPLWLMRPMCPGSGARSTRDTVVANENPCAGLTTPTQFGPMMRTAFSRATASSCCSSLAPSSPDSENPEATTITPLAPISPQSDTACTTRSRGIARITRSGACGKSMMQR